MEEQIYIGYLTHDKSVPIKDFSKKAGVSAATIYKLKQTKIASCFIKRGKKVDACLDRIMTPCKIVRVYARL